MLKYETGSGRAVLRYEIQRYGPDIAIHIDGGAPHLGSVSAGKNGEVSTHVFPGHKEHFLTEPLAKEISLTFGGNVVVTAGVHLEKITKTEIEEISFLHEEAMLHVISLLKQKACESDEDRLSE